MAHFENDNVVAVQIVAHSYEKEMPTTVDCTQWQEDWGLSATLTLFDPVGVNVLLAETMQTALHIFVDSDWVIRQKVHALDKEAVIAEIEALLD